MPTIPALTDATLPLDGTERTVLVQGGLAKDADVAAIARYAEVVNALKLGAWPERIDTEGVYFTTQAAGDPLTTWFAPTLEALAGFGAAIKNTGQLKAYTRGVVSGGADRVYEVEAEVEQVSVGGGETPSVRLGMSSMKADYSATDGSPDAYSPVLATLTAGQIAVLRYRFGFDAPDGGAAWADGAAAIWMRPVVEANRKADNSGFETNSIARVRRFKVTDVTKLVAAEDEALAWTLAYTTAL